MKTKVAVIGASGYTGGELIRLLLFHDDVEVIKATSRTNQGKKISDVHQNFQGYTELQFTNEPVEDIASDVDLIFFALPHSKSMDKVPKAIGKVKIIDLSSDYRLKNPDVYNEFYTKHCSPELINYFEYGLPEINRNIIKKSENVANPGCFPTGSLIALAPLAQNIVIDITFM